ncbi:glycoside hydrolase family 20 zincin-like fold domain-containing protein, partial [Thomasclavelia spiroformis]
MGKKLKKVLTIVVTFAMVFSSLIILNPVNAEGEEQTYAVFPTPHEVVYGDGDFVISDDVNVVYGKGIDSYTKDHTVDVLGLLNKTCTVGEAVSVDKTNVIVGIYNSDDYVDKYFKENNLIDSEELFDKYDSYILSINDGTIAVLGKDTDAAFHGITSLKHIFTQVKDSTILNLKMNDYADVKARGFIEGYYGNPWSNEDRADLMTFGGDYKLNQYIYAP